MNAVPCYNLICLKHSTFIMLPRIRGLKTGLKNTRRFTTIVRICLSHLRHRYKRMVSVWKPAKNRVLHEFSTRKRTPNENKTRFTPMWENVAAASRPVTKNESFHFRFGSDCRSEIDCFHSCTLFWLTKSINSSRRRSKKICKNLW